MEARTWPLFGMFSLTMSGRGTTPAQLSAQAAQSRAGLCDPRAVMLGLHSHTQLCHTSGTMGGSGTPQRSLCFPSQHLPAELHSPDPPAPQHPCSAHLLSHFTPVLPCWLPPSYHLCANSPPCQPNLFNAKLFLALFPIPIISEAFLTRCTSAPSCLADMPAPGCGTWHPAHVCSWGSPSYEPLYGGDTRVLLLEIPAAFLS